MLTYRQTDGQAESRRQTGMIRVRHFVYDCVHYLYRTH